MSEIHLHFNEKPANGMAMFKMALPRAGFDPAVGLPNIQAHWHGAKANQESLGKYFSTLDIKPTDYLPISYPHVMAGTMHMNMLSHKAFPIRLLGALHLKNRIVQYRPVMNNEAVDIDATLGDYRLTDNGVEFDFVTDVSVDGELIWQETSIYLVRGKFGGKENPSLEKSFELKSLTDPSVVHSWNIPKNRGKQYAKISGDYNPIHMSPLAAKMFGFKRDIAHGFGVMAQAMEYSNAVNDLVAKGKSVQVDVVFKGPVFLNSDVSIRQDVEQASERYDVYCENNSRPNICLAVTSVAQEVK
jgi:acyl dehydratase